MAVDGQRISRRTLLAGAAAAALSATRTTHARAEDAAERAPRPARMPAAYVGHGSPMLALDRERGKVLRRWASSFAKPTGIVVVSAHYERAPTTIGATTPRPLIYDFSGFPRPLYQIRYAAPGAPAVARRVGTLLSSLSSVRSDPRRGLDHGAWVPLRWMYPAADVPVLAVSLPTHDAKTLWRMGRALRPLRDEGVLLLASGSLTHNLSKRAREANADVVSWAHDFDRWATDVLSRGAAGELLDWQRRAPAARTNHPTVEHFVPLLITEGARHDGDRATFPVTGFEYGSLSRRSVMLG